MKTSQDLKLRLPALRQSTSVLAPIRIDSLVDGDGVRIVVSGELDMATDAALRDALAAASARRVDLDLSGVSFIGCTTLRVLLQAAATRAEHGGGVSISDASDVVRRLLDMAGMDRLLAG
jgi:anti-anti-sigma factor